MSLPQAARLSAYLAAFRGPLKNLAHWLAVLWLAQVTLTLLEEKAVDHWLVRIVPALIFLIFAAATYQLVRHRAAAFFTPLPISLAWSAVVFGIGPLYQWLAPETASRLSTSMFSTDVAVYAWVALLNTSGLLLTIVGLLIMLRLIRLRRMTLRNSLAYRGPSLGVPGLALDQIFSTRQLLQGGYAVLTLAIALHVVRYGLNKPIAFPGFLSFVDRAGWVSVLFLAIAGGRRGGPVLALALAVAIMEGIIGLMIGIRTEAIAPLVFFFIGYYIGSRSVKGLILAVPVIVIALFVVTPLVKEIRILTWDGGYAGGNTSALSEAYVQQKLKEGEDDPAGYALWMRLDYSPWQAAMMDLYDRGAAGNTYRYIYWTFVPRVIAPSKPLFEVGTDIGFAVQGVSQSSSFSGTVYGEMYWNGGWLAVVVSSLVYGMLLGAVAAGSLWLFLQGNVPAMLIGVSGLLYGLVPDDTFSVSAVGQAVIFLVLLGVYYQSMRFRRDGRLKGAPTPALKGASD
jgi:hypothetical protein